MIVLWLEKHGVFLSIFLLFNSAASAVTAYNVGVFRPNVLILATLTNEIRNLTYHK